MHGFRIWDQLFDSLSSTTTTLRFALLSARRSFARRLANPRQVWPMPLPFPEVQLRKTRDDELQRATKRGLNFCVLVLHHLSHSDVKRKKPTLHTPPLGTALTRQQWDVVRRLRPLVQEWNEFPLVTSSTMGRAASKVESIEEVLAALETEVHEIGKELRSYCGKSSSGKQTGGSYVRESGEVVGHLKQKVAHPAKAVEPHRLKFWKTPTFDPEDFLDPGNAATYRDPLRFAAHPGEVDFKPPKVKVRIKRRDRLKFLELLDSTSRLALIGRDAVRPGYLNGVFTVPKDEEKDRMVLDARPPNGLEKTEDRWIRSLASTQQLQHYFVEEGETVYLFAEDLREFYHSFVVSKQRLRRNALECPVRPWEVRHLSCFEDWMEKEDVLYPALATMAMGDCNAVSYGQASHLGVILPSGALGLEDFVTLTGRPSRRDFIAGLMIDDLVLLQTLGPGVSPLDSEAGLAMGAIREAYERAALPRHEGKAVFGEQRGTFWGLQFDGSSARVRPNLNRCIPLVRIIAEVVRLKFSTVSLLEVISGALISVFQCKRRFMSVMEEIYSVQRDRPRSAILALSRELQEELLCAAALVSIAAVDFRTSPSTRVVASDSSSTMEAAACCPLELPAVRELQKQALQKGLWNRLLSSDKSYLREKGLLDEDSELPEKKYDMHPAWEEIVCSKQFVPFGKIKTRSSRRHINIGEISAALAAEKLHGLLEPSTYYVHLQDSQVSLAALVKGRSSSRAINCLLRSSVPHHVGQGVRPFYGYVRSALNPADDPTRRVSLRRPSRKTAGWLDSMEMGDYRGYDRMLREHGLSASDLQGLPEACELGAPISLDSRSSKEARRGRPPLVCPGLPADKAEIPENASESGSRGEMKKRFEVTEDGDDSAEVEATSGGEKFAGASEELESLESQPTRGICSDEERSRKVEEEREERQQSVEEEEESWQQEILKFPAGQFVYSKCFRSLEEAVRSAPGILDLFSGERGISRACTALFPCWCITFDLKHSAGEDLSSLPLQTKLTRLIHRGAFRAMVAGPVCSSFSTAITPPCRTGDYPEGVPWCSTKQQLKNLVGNEQLAFIIRLANACVKAGVKFSVENPNGSWFWKQKRPRLSWERLMRRNDVDDLRVDYCMFGCPWQKRTRFRTSLHIRGQKLFCSCGLPHLRLRGRCREKGVNFTRLAEPYPRPLCYALAYAIGVDCKYFPELKKKLNIWNCARGEHARLGEAKNPGPRKPPARRSEDLADVELLEPVTIALRAKIWTSFVNWVDESASAGLFPWVLGQPRLLVELLIGYGHAAFREGISLMYFRQLLAHVQRENVAVRPYMLPAWQVVSKWELLEPTNHRPPMPEPLMAAMAALGWIWGWKRWTATLIFSFVGACRVGEVLHARRSHLLLPSDLLSDQPIAYLKIISPKSRRRGARIQYATFDYAALVPLLEAAWSGLDRDDFLYGASPGAFRTRWNALMRKLSVPTTARLTPGSLRAGGAVWLHKRGLGIADVMWRLRLQHQKTLSFYLQEITAESILPSLAPSVRDGIRLLRDFLLVLVELEKPSLT